jgi:Tfp pilus assembly protein PilV
VTTPVLSRENALRPLARDQSGLTLVEMLVAAVLLVTGVLGTFALIDTANRTTSNAASREGATNIAREVLEAAHGTAYTKIGQTDWLRPRLVSLAGSSGSVTAANGYTNQTTVTRRSTAYTVTLTWCSVDDTRDGYGNHDPSIKWCSDSAGTGTGDPQAEDFKRVAVHLTWTVNGAQRSLDQLATFGASGAAIGPTVSSLTLTSPTAADPAAPSITVNPANGLATFRGVSVGAADMRFIVNGAEQQSGAAAAGNGTWTFNWNIAALKDGTYSIGAVAIDALGTRGEPRSIQVTLNRGAPAPLANITGGYNYVTIGGKKTLVLEGAWDANTEGNIIGYEVLRGTSVVCPTSLDTSCVDRAPATTGTTNYSVRTWYRDGAGTARNITTIFTAYAPTFTSIATQYHLTYDSSVPAGANTGTSCRGGTGTGSKFDMRSSTPSFTARTSGSGWVSGCLPPFPAGVSMSASTMNFAAKWTNSTNSNCNSVPFYLYLNGTTLIAGTGVNAGPPLAQISKTSTTSSPASTSNDFTTSARSFATGDQLSFYTPASTTSSSCAGISLYFNSAAQTAKLTLPLTGGGTANLAYPATPSGLAAAPDGNGGTTLTWNAPGGSPAPDFYRIYRDGIELTNRYDTAGDTGDPTVTWTDTDTAGTAHTYYVTSASATLVESPLTGPVTQ